ncbi:MAG: 16S rRNA methyltransferase GidB [uncultured bacterium]|nr:MAG: 16S rRNA methyltransferase GidB [uncultured bacterium]
MKSFLSKALTENGHHFSPMIEQHILAYLDLLTQWNRVFNLTAIRDPNEMVMRHIVDSLSIKKYLHGDRVIDVGSGAGLPGIPLALAEPQKEFVLLDSSQKKTRFLTQAVYELSLKNVTVVHARAECFHPAQGFDSIITRALASLKDMLLATRHLLNEQGQFLAMKGVYPLEEIKDIPDEFTLLSVHELKLQGLDAKRHLVCIKVKGALRGENNRDR